MAHESQDRQEQLDHDHSAPGAFRSRRLEKSEVVGRRRTYVQANNAEQVVEFVGTTYTVFRQR